MRMYYRSEAQYNSIEKHAYHVLLNLVAGLPNETQETKAIRVKKGYLQNKTKCCL